jgi:hypothetical protein
VTATMRTSLIAIGRHPYADYFPVLETPLSSELKALIIRLMAIEIGSNPLSRSPERSCGQSGCYGAQTG